MTAIVFDLTGRRARRVERLLEACGRALRALGGAFDLAAPGVPAASVRLLELAAAYEATQPSYAADLRAAAALMHGEPALRR